MLSLVGPATTAKSALIIVDTRTPRAAAASALCVPRRPARPAPKLTSLASGRGRRVAAGDVRHEQGDCERQPRRPRGPRRERRHLHGDGEPRLRQLDGDAPAPSDHLIGLRACGTGRDGDGTCVRVGWACSIQKGYWHDFFSYRALSSRTAASRRRPRTCTRTSRHGTTPPCTCSSAPQSA